MSKNTYTFPKKLLESDDSVLRYKPERWGHYFWDTLYFTGLCVWSINLLFESSYKLRINRDLIGGLSC